MAAACKGNLVKNPGFELGLSFWQVGTVGPVLNMSNVGVVDRGLTHSGLAALSMGDSDPQRPAAVFQDLRVNAGRVYELDFFVAGLTECAAPLIAEVYWLDEENDEVGLALSIAIPADVIGAAGSGGWVLYTGVTEPAPVTARKARVSFTKGSGKSPVLIDDVVFFQLS